VNVLSVDPGIRGCGCAIFRDGLLFKAEYVKNLEKKGAGPFECAEMGMRVVEWSIRAHTVVLEWPTVYAGRASRGDARDLFPLAGIDTAIAVNYVGCEIVHYVPFEWKSNMNPDVLIRRIQGRLSSEETKRVKLPSAKSLAHNVWDGIGIGLHYLKRLNKSQYNTSRDTQCPLKMVKK
jgi:hypothetical protein